MGDTGTGKSFALEALSQLFRVQTMSSGTLDQLFSSKPTFCESKIASASAIVAHEVSISSLLTVAAKEYCDTTLPERKVNVKYLDPVPISCGVPFLMSTNDFPSDLNVWNRISTSSYSFEA